MLANSVPKSKSKKEKEKKEENNQDQSLVGFFASKQ